MLVAAQREAGSSGGLRDKPGKSVFCHVRSLLLTAIRRPDLYHTCNNLSGLSITQHHVIHSPKLVSNNRAKFDPSRGFPAVKPTTLDGGWKSEDERQAVRREVWANALGWVEREEDEILVGGKANRVVSLTCRSWAPS